MKEPKIGGAACLLGKIIRETNDAQGRMFIVELTGLEVMAVKVDDLKTKEDLPTEVVGRKIEVFGTYLKKITEGANGSDQTMMLVEPNFFCLDGQLDFY